MKSIDFLVKIIDNWGDLAFAYRLALQMQTERKIRFFCDDWHLFEQFYEKNGGSMEIYTLEAYASMIPSERICNFFDAPIPFSHLHTHDFPITLVNFSYFLMHDGVKSLHENTYESKNITVTHYIPSLLSEWWGILPNTTSKNTLSKKQFSEKYFPHCSDSIEKKWVSVFCYPDTFTAIAPIFSQYPEYVFLVFQYDATGENTIPLPFLSFTEYENLLSLCDINIVRWENSFLEVLQTGKPWLWDIYKEPGGFETEKIEDMIRYLWTIQKYEVFFWGFA